MAPNSVMKPPTLDPTKCVENCTWTGRKTAVWAASASHCSGDQIEALTPLNFFKKPMLVEMPILARHELDRILLKSVWHVVHTSQRPPHSKRTGQLLPRGPKHSPRTDKSCR